MLSYLLQNFWQKSVHGVPNEFATAYVSYVTWIVSPHYLVKRSRFLWKFLRFKTANMSQ